ncbi:MAG: DUF3000 domain-containing protein [Actinomycetota bacterium]
MSLRKGFDEAPEDFRRARNELHNAIIRPEVRLTETPAPSRVAPYATALTADVSPGTGQGHDNPLATGRFVLLHDPQRPDSWGGVFRVVAFVRAELEAELGGDPLLGAVGWAWLTDALHDHGAQHTRAGGTVTRIMSESFAALAGRPPGTEMELRASWTPTDDAFDHHLLAWVDVLCSAGGIPSLPAGVHAFPGRAGVSPATF